MIRGDIGNMVIILRGTLIAAVIFWVIWNVTHPHGIFPTPDGEAVYLEGQACVINMEPHNSYSQSLVNFNFCTCHRYKVGCEF